MPKARKPVVEKKKPVSPEPAEKGTITYSIRLTKEQRDRVAAAARERGWTPTNLIRVAVLEKAAHILNTSRVTSFNLREVARWIANSLYTTDSTEEYSRLPAFEEAARLGGTELLNLVMAEWVRAMSGKPLLADLPAPIEPR